MQYKPANWVTGFKRSPRAANVQNRDMGLFLNSSGKFEPIDDSWDNLHSGGLFISDDNKLYFRDETNKDIYINSPADNQITIGATSGVGINTTPAETFHVVDTTSEGGVLIDNTATDGNPILAFGLSGTKTFTMGVDDGDSDKFKIFSGDAIDGTSEFVIDGSGKVGIGVADPDVEFELNGKMKIDRGAGNGTFLELRASTDTWSVYNTGTVLTLGDSSQDVISFDTSGGVGIGAAPGTLLELFGTAPYLTLRNSTHEDGDGGRESKIIFEGEQSGGEDSTLAVIQASHDGTSDDQKGDLIFYTNDGSDGASPTPRMRIDSAGNVGIGADDPSANLHIKGAVAANGGVYNYIENTGTGYTYLKMESDSNAFSFLVGGSGTATADQGTFIISDSPNQRFTISSAGDVNVKTGNLVIGTAGKGIDFSNQASPAAGMTSELLDRYEEGTFTPTFTGVTSISYTTQLGFYSRVGDTVYVLFYFLGNWTASGQLVLNGLPFTVSLSSGAAINISFQNCEAVAPVGYGATGTTTATFYEQGTLGTTWNPPSVTGKYLVGSGVYKTAT